ncbi:hypothetical protein [Brevundimonas sp.]|uniref:hypothetical protein n=1 Tax=Brevundimonas sp. TaxID=1871086 RepID=UPI0035AF4B02
MRLSLIATVGLVGLLAACSSGPEAPSEPQVCYHLGNPGVENEEPRFNEVAENVESLEHCAAQLEVMRLSFLRMGGSVQEITGAYGGQFIFIDRQGVWVAQSFDGGRFFTMTRSGDGRLIVPSAIDWNTAEARAAAAQADAQPATTAQ